MAMRQPGWVTPAPAPHPARPPARSQKPWLSGRTGAFILLIVVGALSLCSGRLAWEEKVHADTTAGDVNVQVDPSRVTGIALLITEPQIEPQRPERGVLKTDLATASDALKQARYGGTLRCSAHLDGPYVVVHLPKANERLTLPVEQTNWAHLDGTAPKSLRLRFSVDVAHPTFDLNQVSGVIFDIPSNK